jgi:hypothetical protein
MGFVEIGLCWIGVVEGGEGLWREERGKEYL